MDVMEKMRRAKDRFVIWWDRWRLRHARGATYLACRFGAHRRSWRRLPSSNHFETPEKLVCHCQNCGRLWMMAKNS